MYPKWNSINFDDLKGVPYLNGLRESEKGLFLFFFFQSGNKLIHFNDYFVLRVIDEGNALKTLEQQSFDGKSWLFVSTNSDLIDWFNDQSYSIHENEYKHYIVVSQHKILEILSSVPPEIVDGIHFASN